MSFNCFNCSFYIISILLSHSDKNETLNFFYIAVVDLAQYFKVHCYLLSNVEV